MAPSAAQVFSTPSPDFKLEGIQPPGSGPRFSVIDSDLVAFSSPVGFT